MEILIAIGIFIVAFVLGGVYGYNLRERIAQRVIEKTLSQLEKVQEEVRKDLIHITVEKHESRLFIYNKESNEFMAQGTTMDELNDALEKRFPGKKFACSEEHLEIIKGL